MADYEQKQLKIKVNTVKRVQKELTMYTDEEQAEQAKVAQMRAAGADATDIKFAVRTIM